MTKSKKTFVLFYLCLTASLIVSCTSTTPTPLATTTGGPPRPTAYEQLPPPAVATLGAEIKRFSGNGNNAETTIKLDTKQILRVNWKQDCVSNFYLSLVNADPTLAEQDGGEITLSIASGPNYGYSDYDYEPGTYKINIESDGSWEIWVEVIIQKQEIVSPEEP